MATSTIKKASISLNDCESNQVVSLNNYTSANPYILPHDGYIRISSDQNDRGYIRVIITSPSGEVQPYMYMNIIGAYQIQSLYVKKGMKVYNGGVSAEKSIEMIYYPLTK